MSFELRDFHPEDLRTVLSLFYNSVHHVASRDYSAAQCQAWAPSALDEAAWLSLLKSSWTRLAMCQEELLGFVCLSEQQHVDMLYVSPDAQRIGVGRSMLAAAETQARSLEADRMTAAVSLTARGLFEACGFEVGSAERVHRADVGLDRWRMYKVLDA